MKENKVKLSGIPKFRPPGSEASGSSGSRKKSWKAVLIFFVFALVFAVFGFIDLKVNAAESETSGTENEVVVYLNTFCDVDGVIQQEVDRKFVIKGNEDIEIFYYQSHTEPTKETSQANFYVASKYPFTITAYGRPIGTSTYNQVYDYNINATLNNCGVYHHWDTSYYGNGQFYKYHTFETDYANTTQLNTSYYYDTFLEYYLKNELDVKVDYNSFEIDDDMPTIQNLLYNIIRNEKPSENDTTGLGIIKDVEYYEYLTWNNTKKLPIQVEYVPIVQVYSGLIKEKFKKEYYGEWTDFEILSADTNSYTKRTDSEYLFENDRVGKDFEDEILNTYVEYGDNTYLFYGYRLRYVDENSKLCSPWVYAVPRENGTYYSYVEYSDSSTTDDEDITGTDNTYDNIDDIENAKTDIDKENEVKNEYGYMDNDINVEQATGWLYSVVDFIKGTPQLVGSVLSFLPKPILHGMYVTIFLGVFACCIAIAKALF